MRRHRGTLAICNESAADKNCVEYYFHQFVYNNPELILIICNWPDRAAERDPRGAGPVPQLHQGDRQRGRRGRGGGAVRRPRRGDPAPAQHRGMEVRL